MPAGAVAGKTIFDAVGRQQRDPKVAILAGADDALVVARNGQGNRRFGVGGRAREATPSETAFVALHDERRFELAYARRIGKGVRARMMGIVAEDDRLALPRPGALQIGNGILCARAGNRGAKQHQCEDEVFHCFPPCTDAAAATTVPANSRIAAISNVMRRNPRKGKVSARFEHRVSRSPATPPRPSEMGFATLNPSYTLRSQGPRPRSAI